MKKKNSRINEKNLVLINYHHKKEVICYSSFDKYIRFLDWNAQDEFEILKEHDDKVNVIEFSSFNDGKYLYLGSADKHVMYVTSKIINIFIGHKATSYDIEYSHFVNIVCYSSYDHTIRFWSTKMNNQEHYINTSKNKDNGIKCIKFIKSKNNDFKKGQNMMKMKRTKYCVKKNSVKKIKQ
ncbi:WD-40 repeat protein [Reticulomyxa filosa]|uniref:WD-40 repeat protein n=1 Tax=Reticulomyxa filosa TaxID=46433 RepID=X6LCT7_RETFI|nr:WD-40 repeat protein [Reticulomyxa filosa]|eukprot:ETN98896.1 WD-40 repeat protein [Reticulomyxa filosa]